MREDKSYSIHKQPHSKPHRIGSKKPSKQESSTPPAAQKQTSEPLVVESKESEEQRQADNREQAVDYARAKIAAAFGEEAAPEPGQSAAIAEGHAKEQVLQDKIEPQAHHVQPDHELPAPREEYGPPTTPAASSSEYRQQYGTFPLPGEQQAPQPAAQQTPAPKPKQATSKKTQHKSKTDNFKQLRDTIKEKKQSAQQNKVRKPWFKRLAPVATLVTVLLLVLNNQLVYGQIAYYVTPGDRVETPTIVEPSIDNSAPKGSRIIIPKINVNVPVNYSVDTYDEDAIQAGLEDGVVHYNNTGLPGEVGNNVILGHNTNNFWNSGRYKTAFVLLDRLENGDTFELHHEGKRYIYEMYEKKVIEPDDFSVVTQEVTEPIVTLVTCHPPGTSWKRLIVQARQISPEPTRADKTTANELPDAVEGNLPANSDSALESIFGWLF